MNMEKASDVEQVLMNEVDNPDGVYMYLEGDSWCAYERSAYYLSSLRVPVKLEKEVVRGGYDVVLLKAMFKTSEMTLPLSPMALLKQVSDDKVLFQIKDPARGFSQWKADQLRILSA
jgi:hypothetical protein